MQDKYEQQLRDLAREKDKENEELRDRYEAKIRDLEEQLRKERANLEGNAKEREQ